MFLHYLKKNVLDMCIFDKKTSKSDRNSNVEDTRGI